MSKLIYKNLSQEDINFLIHSRLKQKVRDKKHNKFVQPELPFFNDNFNQKKNQKRK